MNFSPGPCVFVFDVMEWMKHMSSASSARCGSRSDMYLPDCPRWLNSQGLLVRLPGLALKRDQVFAARHGLAVVLDQLGL